jgi:hypothetical protein
VQRLQPDHELRRIERTLFGDDVDQVVRVQRIQVAHLHPFGQRGARGGTHQQRADARVLEVRMCCKNQDRRQGCDAWGLPLGGQTEGNR